MKSFKNNYKLYSLRLFNIQIIPSYYDLKRFLKSFIISVKKDFPIKIQKSGFEYQFNRLLNPNLNKQYKRNPYNKLIDNLLYNKKNVLSD